MPNMNPKKNPMPTQEPQVRCHNFKEVADGYTQEIALDEAARCLNCKNMPCVAGCPVNIHIPEFIAKVREGDFEGAYQVIQQTVVSARRKNSAKSAVSAGSRANRSELAVWNVLSLTGTMNMRKKPLRPLRPTVIVSPLSVPVHPV